MYITIIQSRSTAICGPTVTHGIDPPVALIYSFLVFRIQVRLLPLPLPLSLSLSLSLFLFPLRPRLPSVPAICPSLGIDRVRRGAERYPPGAAGLVACNLPVPGHCQCDEARGSSFPLFSARIQNSVLAMQNLVPELRILLGTIIIRGPPPSAI